MKSREFRSTGAKRLSRTCLCRSGFFHICFTHIRNGLKTLSFKAVSEMRISETALFFACSFVKIPPVAPLAFKHDAPCASQAAPGVKDRPRQIRLLPQEAQGSSGLGTLPGVKPEQQKAENGYSGGAAQSARKRSAYLTTDA